MTHKGTVTIETERLILRRFNEGDAQAMFDSWAGDSEVTKFLQWKPHESGQAFRQNCRRKICF